jgi:hypothetical protein
MKKQFIEVQFYGSKGAYNGDVGQFRSIENLKGTWQNFLNNNDEFGSLKDDQGRLLKGISTIGYKILTKPKKI